MKRNYLLLLLLVAAQACGPCYKQELNQNCRSEQGGQKSYTLHMSVHPHLDAFWIFNFESYYDPKPNEGQVRGYFQSNRFSSVKQIFNTARDVLWDSKTFRQNESNSSQRAHRSFFNSEMGFFKRWYMQQDQKDKNKVKQILKTKYWEILGGGYVEHDQGCAYYDDIIQNFELGLHFLKEQLNYYPRVAVSADSFGHSQTSLAILAHLGVEGYFVQRSDEHILLQNKTQFIWKAKSANGLSYGALPTHIRWAIHGFQDQFIGGNINEQFCQTKQGYINNLRNQNNFLKRILKSPHVMRYFGHDFQKFDNYSYSVIEGMMLKFSLEKCNKVVAVYGNPTEYFITLMRQVFGTNAKPIVTRSEDIFPIWDYDSGLYWTGYFTTDAYHKKSYRDLGRFLRAVRKVYLPLYLSQPKSQKNMANYQLLEQASEQVSYLQHHDGISGTSKYRVMDQLQKINEDITHKLQTKILSDIFIQQFPLGTSNPIFNCHIDQVCKIPKQIDSDILLKIINTDGNPRRDPLIIQLPFDNHFTPDCEHEINCLCIEQICPCKIYINAPLATYTVIRLKKVEKFDQSKVNRLTSFVSNQQFSYNSSHFSIALDGKKYAIGYKRIEARSTGRQYSHLTRYGTQSPRSFNVRPGKYALGNDPNKIRDFSQIKKVSWLKSETYTLILIIWKRYKMTTLISIPKSRKNQWKVETITASQSYYLSDLYLQIGTSIDNKNKFYTDSNGWLTVPRQLFKHEDYEAYFSKQKYDDIDGNSYPATAFAYLQDSQDKVSVNVDRPQGVIAYQAGSLWFNFDRLSQDDGKWVYENAYRSEYQKYTHTITVQNKNNNERRIQRRYDQPLLVQGNSIASNIRVEDISIDFAKRNEWNAVSNIDNIKFMIRPFNDSTTIVRVHNMDDSQTLTVGLFATNHSPLLTTFYERTVNFSSVVEQSLGGNMDYSEFINNKWNWHKVIDLSQQNKIFTKTFRENITLRPLQIRTFLFKDLNFAENCIQTSQLKYNQLSIDYDLDKQKQQPSREALTIKIQQNVIQFMLQGDHCNSRGPILDSKNIQTTKVQNSGKGKTVFEPKKIEQSVPVVVSEISVKEPQAQPSSLQQQQPQIKKIQQIQQINLLPQLLEKQPKKVQNENVQPNTQPIQNESLSIVVTGQALLRNIQEKVQTLKPLTAGQKQQYFTRKLQMIRKIKAATKV